MTAGDFGQPFAIQVTGADLTQMDNIAIVIRKPDGTQVTWEPTTVTPTVAARTVLAGDLDQAGMYTVKVVLTWGIFVDPPGQTTSTSSSFMVDPGA